MTFLKNVETRRYAFCANTVVGGSEGGWTGQYTLEHPMLGTDKDYYHRSEWIVEVQGDCVLFRNEFTKRYIFDQAPVFGGRRGEEGGWTSESPQILTTDSDYYERARWRVLENGDDTYTFLNSFTKRILFDPGDVFGGTPGAEGGWVGGHMKPLISTDNEYYSRSHWNVEGNPIPYDINKSSPEAWGIDLGFVHLGSGGMDVKPQLQFGVHSKNLDFGVGLGDLRDGISFGAEITAKQVFTSAGSTINQCIDSLHADNDLGEFGELVGTVSEFLLKFSMIYAHPEYLFIVWVAGDLDLSAAGRIEMKITVSTGVSISASACLGWCDTSGYHMLGAGGEVAVGLKLEANVMAGVHESGNRLKAIIGCPHIATEIVWFW